MSRIRSADRRGGGRYLLLSSIEVALSRESDRSLPTSSAPGAQRAAAARQRAWDARPAGAHGCHAGAESFVRNGTSKSPCRGRRKVGNVEHTWSVAGRDERRKNVPVRPRQVGATGAMDDGPWESDEVPHRCTWRELRPLADDGIDAARARKPFRRTGLRVSGHASRAAAQGPSPAVLDGPWVGPSAPVSCVLPAGSYPSDRARKSDEMRWPRSRSFP
jgi:hypothetical protein